MRLFDRTETIDLAEDFDTTFALLEDASWKKRAVEEITIGSALSLDSRRSFQCADLRATLGSRVARHAKNASLLLPLTTLPKRPLLGFDVSAPDRTVAHLPSRAALADVEASFVIRLARSGGVSVAHEVAQLITKICEFTPGRWERWRVNDSDPTRLKTYLERACAWSLTLDEVEPWLAEHAAVRAVLSEAIGLPPDPSSSAENPALVLPLVQTALGIKPTDVLPLLVRYRNFVERCANLDDVEPFAPNAVLAEYGRLWEVIIHCTVPLDGPFIVRMAERRPVNVGRRGSVDLTITTGDAVSNHSVVRVTDANVEISDPLQALALYGSPLDDAFDGIRVTREEVAVYAADIERDYRLVLRFRLSTATRVKWTNRLVAALVAMSIGVVLARWSVLDEGDLAVVAIPTTFAASLLLTRERTTLASRLSAGWHIVVLVLTGLLWLLVAALYIGDTRVSRVACPAEPVTPQVFATSQHSPHDPRSCDGQEHR